MTVESDAGHRTAGHADGVLDLDVTVHKPVTAVWQGLISPAGTAVWLGAGAVLGGKGESYHCDDGSTGVLRSFHPLEQLRVSWHPGDDAPASLVEIDLDDRGAETVLRLHHSGIAGDTGELRQRWQERLAALSAHVERDAASV